MASENKSRVSTLAVITAAGEGGINNGYSESLLELNKVFRSDIIGTKCGNDLIGFTGVPSAGYFILLFAMF